MCMYTHSDMNVTMEVLNTLKFKVPLLCNVYPFTQLHPVMDRPTRSRGYIILLSVSSKPECAHESIDCEKYVHHY